MRVRRRQAARVGSVARMRDILLAALLALPLLSLAVPAADAAPPSQCTQVYHEEWIAEGTGYVMRDSCHTEIWVAGHEVHDLLA